MRETIACLVLTFFLLPTLAGAGIASRNEIVSRMEEFLDIELFTNTQGDQGCLLQNLDREEYDCSACSCSEDPIDPEPCCSDILWHYEFLDHQPADIGWWGMNYSYGGDDIPDELVVQGKIDECFGLGSHKCHYDGCGDPSGWAVGADCSAGVCYAGDVDRVNTWGLDSPDVGVGIEWEDVTKGSYLNWAGAHVVLVKDRVGQRVTIQELTGYWPVAREVPDVELLYYNDPNKGYVPRDFIAVAQAEGLGCDCDGGGSMSWACIKLCFGGGGGTPLQGEAAPHYTFGWDDSYILAWNDFGDSTRQEYLIFRSSAPDTDSYELVDLPPAGRGRWMEGWDNCRLDYDVEPRVAYKYRIASSPDGERIDHYLEPARSGVAFAVDALDFFAPGSQYGSTYSLVLCADDLIYQFTSSRPDSGTRAHALRVVDAATPASLQQICSLDISDAIPDFMFGPLDMALRGNLLFLCTNRVVAIFDVSDPIDPVLLTSIGPPEDHLYQNISASGDYLYVATYDRVASTYLQVWDVSDVYAPECALPYSSFSSGDFIVEGDLMLTTYGAYDVSDPVSPQQISYFYDGMPAATSVCGFDGGFLYTSSGTVDLRVPSAPVVVDTLDHMLDEDWLPTRHADRKGNYLVVPGTYGGWDCVELFDVSDPLESKRVGLFRSAGSGLESPVSVGADLIAVVGTGDVEKTAPVRVVLDDQRFTFRATGSDGFITAQWRTSSPSAVDGFNLLRATSYDGPFDQLNSSLITSSSQYTTDGGVSYEFLDEGVVCGDTYVYRLQGVRADTTDIWQTDCATPYVCRPSCVVTSPVAGQLVSTQSGCMVEWRTFDDGPTSHAKLYYQLDGEGDFLYLWDTEDDGVVHWPAHVGISGAHVCRLRIEIHDVDGNVALAESEEFILYDYGPHCPYICVWDGDTYVPDNSLLPACEWSPGAVDVTDHYRLGRRPPLVNGEYKLRILALEPDDVWIDSVSLKTVDHAPGADIVVTEGGELVAVEDPVEPIRCIDELGQDQLAGVVTPEDGVSLVKDGGYLDVAFAVPESLEGGTICYRAAGKYHSGISELFPTGTRSAGWDTIDQAASRSMWFSRGVDIAPWLPECIDENGEMPLRLSWEGAREFDYICFGGLPEGELTENSAAFRSAMQPGSGKVKSKLLSDDGNYVHLEPGEYVDLVFESLPQEWGTERDLVLVTTGYYLEVGREGSPAGDESEPPEELGAGVRVANYPNPFHPDTRVVYTVPEPGGPVTVRVFSAAGGVVAELLDHEVQTPGLKSIVWDGTNRQGERVGSGVYFCVIEGPGFSQRQKMVLLR
jgi:hypothetical protein